MNFLGPLPCAHSYMTLGFIFVLFCFLIGDLGTYSPRISSEGSGPEAAGSSWYTGQKPHAMLDLQADSVDSGWRGLKEAVEAKP